MCDCSVQCNIISKSERRANLPKSAACVTWRKVSAHKSKGRSCCTVADSLILCEDGIAEKKGKENEGKQKKIINERDKSRGSKSRAQQQQCVIRKKEEKNKIPIYPPDHFLLVFQRSHFLLAQQLVDDVLYLPTVMVMLSSSDVPSDVLFPVQNPKKIDKEISSRCCRPIRKCWWIERACSVHLAASSCISASNQLMLSLQSSSIRRTDDDDKNKNAIFLLLLRRTFLSIHWLKWISASYWRDFIFL